MTKLCLHPVHTPYKTPATMGSTERVLVFQTDSQMNR
jgi:hypothetical protein